MSNNNLPLAIEQIVREAFNATNQTRARKERLHLPGGQAKHEFDLYEQHRVIGGVSTSRWRNGPSDAKRRSNNTAGQDRASTEILWLSHWEGLERRIHVLTDEEMAVKLYRRYRGIPMKAPIEIHHFNLSDAGFTLIGSLGI